MPEMDGYETCRQLREWATIPIIFATAFQSLDVHLKAYDVGANDIVTKPVVSEILLRKVELAIRHHQNTKLLTEEKDSLQKMAMSFLSSMGENGTLLNFMRASVASRTHLALAEQLVSAVRELGVECSVMIRHNGGPTALTNHGEPTPLELSILEQSSGMGRLFQFKRRLVVNYDRVSIIVANIPENSDEHAGRLRDNIATLAETAEALCENVDMRIESMKRAEQLQVALGGAVGVVESLRTRYFASMADISQLLHELVVDMEKTFSWLGTNQTQEMAISQTMEASVQRIMNLLADSGNFDQQFATVLDALRGGSDQNEIELF
jgi:CheY-like chemotaxis protein